MAYEIMGIRGENFGCLREFELELYNRGLTQIVGVNNATTGARSNGSGKTTLPKALSWVLFGKTIDGDEFDRVIRRGCLEAWVEAELRDPAGGVWTLRRGRKLSSPSLEIKAPSGKAYVASKGDLQAVIQKMIGFDFDTFRNTVLFGQGDDRRFASAKLGDVERKQILHRIMRTERLRSAEEIARKRAGEKKKKIAAIEVEIARLEGQAGEHDTIALANKSDRWEFDRTERYEAALTKARETLADAKEKQAAGADVEAHEETQRSLVEKIAIAEAKEKRLAELRDQITKATAVAAKTESAEATAEQALTNAQDALDALTGDECPECEAPLRKGAAPKTAAKLERLRKAKIDAEKNFTKAIADNETAKADLETKKGAAKKCKAHVDTLPALRRQLEEIRDALRDARNAVQLSKAIADEARSQVAAAKTIKAEINPYTETLEAALGRRDAIRKELEEKQCELAGERETLSQIDFWIRGFSGQGIPSFVLESALPFITERSNHYLATLADGDIHAELTAISTTKGGELRDKIALNIHVEGVADVTPSGGQERKVEIASDLALMDLAAREIGRPPLLIFDEVLDGLDDEGQDRVIRLLQELRGRFGSIFVITHKADLSESFEHVVRVTKARDGSSTVETVA